MLGLTRTSAHRHRQVRPKVWAREANGIRFRYSVGAVLLVFNVLVGALVDILAEPLALDSAADSCT